MKVTIDASNLLAGGGLVHLQNLLLLANPQVHGFQKIIVYGGQNLLESFPKKDFLELREIQLNRSYIYRLQWQENKLQKLAKQKKALIFVPGGLFLGKYSPFVTMFQNMQVFETLERNREGWTKEWFRLFLLKVGQGRTFRKSAGLICLSEYSRNYLQQFYPQLLNDVETRLIPHGVIQHDQNPRDYRFKDKIRLLYVSTVKKYKHQWHLIESVAELLKQSYPLELHLIGSGDPSAIKRMSDTIQKHTSLGKFVYCHGGLTHKETLDWFDRADLFAYPSSCENLPIILLEAMSSGLPIACSDRGPMPEVLRDAGKYFNPEQPDSIAASLKLLLDDESLRQKLGSKAQMLSQNYSWERCANDTFSFLQKVNNLHYS